MDTIDQSIQRQMTANESKNLLYAHCEQIIEIDPGFLAALEELLAGGEQALSPQTLQEVVSYAARSLLNRIHALNQFLRVEHHQIEELEGIYRHTWEKLLHAGDIQATLKEHHYPALSRWLAGLYPGDFVASLKQVPSVKGVVCEEYSPQLQIELLGIDLEAMRRPCVDIGCGSHANLAHHLHARNIPVLGIDRHLEQPEAYLQQVDWFAFTFEAQKWGTVISNMAFSNHLLYAYRHDRLQLEPYLRKYKEIIESLCVGGCFFYAPHIPFIEERLKPAQYRVERKAVYGELFASQVTRLAG